MAIGADISIHSDWLQVQVQVHGYVGSGHGSTVDVGAVDVGAIDVGASTVEVRSRCENLQVGQHKQGRGQHKTSKVVAAMQAEPSHALQQAMQR